MKKLIILFLALLLTVGCTNNNNNNNNKPSNVYSVLDNGWNDFESFNAATVVSSFKLNMKGLLKDTKVNTELKFRILDDESLSASLNASVPMIGTVFDAHLEDGVIYSESFSVKTKTSSNDFIEALLNDSPNDLKLDSNTFKDHLLFTNLRNSPEFLKEGNYIVSNDNGILSLKIKEDSSLHALILDSFSVITNELSDTTKVKNINLHFKEERFYGISVDVNDRDENDTVTLSFYVEDLNDDVIIDDINREDFKNVTEFKGFNF